MDFFTVYNCLFPKQMSESKSEFRQYVTAPMTDKDLITMAYRFWPRGKINLTRVVLDTLVKKCMPYIFSPKNENALRSHIRKIWSKRKQILGPTLFAELDAKRTRFSDEDAFTPSLPAFGLLWRSPSSIVGKCSGIG